jgi:hypothetical protein
MKVKERLSSRKEAGGATVSSRRVHFPTLEYTTAVSGLPHSKQDAFSRDVINPHDGHIL